MKNTLKEGSVATKEEAKAMETIGEGGAKLGAKLEASGADTAGVKGLVPEETMNQFRVSFPSVKQVGGVLLLIGFAIRFQMVDKEECKKNCQKLLNPPLKSTMFGYSSGDKCLSDPTAPFGEPC